MASSSSSSLRLMSDLKTMKQNPPEGVSASPMLDENLYVWGGTVFGPDDTAWEGGIYSMRLTFTEQYPDKPPRVRFTSEMVRPIPPTPRAPLSILLPSA
jgi:ubiquitin-conjugating enzyme E2 A